MSACIRLRRIGKNPKGRYFFRISVFDKRKSRDSRSIEELGYYNPSKEPELIKINKERLEYWLSCGAQMSQKVACLVNRVDKKPELPETDSEKQASETENENKPESTKTA